MKYDTYIDINNSATSNTKLLTNIPHGAYVLELGSAAGSMTKYMSETLECKVCIVELDKELFDNAKQYAQDAFCGNLENDDWLEYYKGKKFDIIMMSNVLEHLRNPLHVLRIAQTLLNPNGKILLSLPNVTHNDVILNMMHDDWHYTDAGLLDQTHITFFGEKNYYSLIADSGLFIEKEDRVFLDTLETEQSPYADDIPEAVLSYLKSRQNGDVYQFIAICTKQKTAYHAPVKNINRTDRLLSEQQFKAKAAEERKEEIVRMIKRKGLKNLLRLCLARYTHRYDDFFNL